MLLPLVGDHTLRITGQEPVVKNLPANAGDIRDTGLIPRSGRYPRGGNGNPFQYSCLENPMDRGAWQATVHRVHFLIKWFKMIPASLGLHDNSKRQST